MANNPERTLTLKILGEQRDAQRALDKTADGLDKVADATEKMGKSLDDSSKKQTSSLSKLEKQLDESRQKARALAEEFARTGDDEPYREFNREQRTVRKLERIQKALAVVGESAQDSGDDLDILGGDVRTLGARMDAARASVERLADEARATGNVDVFRKLREDRETLAKLERINRELTAVGNRHVEATVDVDVDRPSLALRTLGSLSERVASTIPLIGSAFQSAMRIGSTGAANTGTAVTNLATNLANIIAVAAAAGAALAAGMAVGGAAISVATGLTVALAGALASLPALGVGAAAGLGTLALGVSGLADNYKEMTAASTAAGGAAQDLTPKIRAVEAATRELSHAERDVADAQLAAADAAQDVIRAREEEKERVEDLGRSLAGARLDERGAVLDVKDAEEELKKARRSGDARDIERAELAYEQAQLRVEEVTDRVGDLTKEQEKASKVGVEGSDAVQSALERQRQAQLRVVDAQERQVVATQRLADAQKALAKGPAGGGGVAKELTKLAPAAQKFLDTVIDLKPAFDRLRLGVQQRLFVGLSGTLRTLAARWLPALETSLGSFADTFNGLAKTFAERISTPKFISQMQTGMESVRRLVEKVGGAIAGPLVDAFGDLTEAAGPFIDALGDELADLVTDFSDWVDSASKSGQLQSFMEKAGDFLHDVFDIGRDVGRILGGIAEALFGDKGSGAETGWEAIVDAFDRLGDWFQDPENQKRITDFVNKLEGVSVGLYSASITISGWIEKIDGWVKKVEHFAQAAKTAFLTVESTAATVIAATVGKFEGFVGFLGGLPERIAKIAIKLFPTIGPAAGAAVAAATGHLNALPGLVSGLGGRIGRAARGMWDGIWQAFKDSINRIIRAWNRLELTIGGGSFLGVNIPGKTFGTPDITPLAKGGDVRTAGRALVGERGPELLDLPAGARVTPLPSVGSGTGAVNVTFAPGGTTLEQLLAKFINEGIRTGKIQVVRA